MIDKLNWIVVYPEALLLVMACVIALADLRVKTPAPAHLCADPGHAGVVACMQACTPAAARRCTALAGMVVSDPMGNWLKCFATWR
jgi:NADH-quinone oxidoreductase subunit N